jgi:CRISPR-associated protein Csh2
MIRNQQTAKEGNEMTTKEKIEGLGKSVSEEHERVIIKNRNEFLFLYDIKNGNPNGDPDENRPRIDEVTKKCYVTDVRLKRFVRDYMIQTEGEESILVTELNRKTVNLTDRVRQRLLKDKVDEEKQKKMEGIQLLSYLLDNFTDLRLFGSPLAFGFPQGKQYEEIKKNWGETGTLTGPIQINFGETLHEVEEVTFHGTSTFGSREEKEQGTFTTYYAIPYGLIAFHGVANENAAKMTSLGEKDMDKFKVALWRGVRESSSAHTRTKREQQPRLLLNIIYKDKIKIKEKKENDREEEKEVPTEYHIGALEEKIKLIPKVDEEINIRKVGDYALDPNKLLDSIEKVKEKIKRIEYCLSPEFNEIFETGNPVKKIGLVEKLREISKNAEKEDYFEVVDLNLDRVSTGV